MPVADESQFHRGVLRFEHRQGAWGLGSSKLECWTAYLPLVSSIRLVADLPDAQQVPLAGERWTGARSA